MARTCAECFFHDGPAVGGVCRRNAPSALIVTAGGPSLTWPVVAATDWCGDGYNSVWGWYNNTALAPPVALTR